MSTSPRNIRLSESALKAIKILQREHPSGKRGEAVSDALVTAANGKSTGRVIRLNLLDPEEILTIRAELAEAYKHYAAIKKDIFKIRPQDKDSAQKIADVCSRSQKSLDILDAISSRLSEMARLTTQIGPEEAKCFQALINWAKACSRKTGANPEHIHFYAFMAKFLQALFP